MFSFVSYTVSYIRWWLALTATTTCVCLPEIVILQTLSNLCPKIVMSTIIGPLHGVTNYRAKLLSMEPIYWLYIYIYIYIYLRLFHKGACILHLLHIQCSMTSFSLWSTIFTRNCAFIAIIVCVAVRVHIVFIKNFVFVTTVMVTAALLFTIRIWLLIFIVLFSSIIIGTIAVSILFLRLFLLKNFLPLSLCFFQFWYPYVL